jgi:hypothetical protein
MSNPINPGGGGASKPPPVADETIDDEVESALGCIADEIEQVADMLRALEVAAGGGRNADQFDDDEEGQANEYIVQDGCDTILNYASATFEQAAADLEQLLDNRQALDKIDAYIKRRLQQDATARALATDDEDLN